MSVELKVYQVRVGDGDFLAAHGEIRVEDAIAWLTQNFSQGSLANWGAAGYVESIDQDRLVIGRMDYSVKALSQHKTIEGLTEIEGLEEESHFSWRYEFAPGGPDYTEFALHLLPVLRTYAKAYGYHYPTHFGAEVVD